MEALMIYLFKCAGLISIFYLAYLVLLRNETFFSDNRKYLLGGILASFILPVVYFTRTIFVQPTPGNAFIPQLPEINSVQVEQALDWWQITGIIYLFVFAILLLRFFVQLFRVIQLIISLRHYSDGKFRFIETSAEGPFSFFNYIIFNPESHSVEELSLVLKHENVHARQMHSVDIIISHLACCVLWFNPFSWLYKKSITENLEYIADKETVNETASKKEYLHTLVKVTLGDIQLALTNSFYQPFIKKRIMMLNKKTNNNNNIWKMGLVLPALLAFMLSFNVRTEAQVINNDNNRAEVSEIKISGVVTKESKNESLTALKEAMEKRDVELEITEVKRNDQGFITAIEVDLLNKKTNTSANYSVSDSDGISPFEIYVKENGESGFGSFSETTVSGSRKELKNESSKTKVSVNVQNGVTETGTPPEDVVYVVNGKPSARTVVTQISPEEVENVTVYKGAKAQALYGSSARNGAILISTKNPSDSTGAGYNFKTGTLIIQDSIDENQTRTFRAHNVHYFPNDSTSSKTYAVSISGDDKGNPLYIVDGKVMPEDFDPKKIEESNIESIKVWKGETALEKYGEKGKFGVIEISTKEKKDKKDKKN